MKAQATLEALITMSVAIAVISVFVSLSVKEFNSSQEFMNKINAEASAEKCAQAINSMNANPGAVLSEWKESCSGKNLKTVYWTDENTEAKSRTLATVKSLEKKEGKFVRIENETHYR